LTGSRKNTRNQFGGGGGGKMKVADRRVMKCCENIWVAVQPGKIHGGRGGGKKKEKQGKKT